MGGSGGVGGGMNEPHFHSGKMDEACDLVIRHHYSRRVPSNVQFVGTLHETGGLFGDYGRAIAACFFTIPGTRWSEDVLELARLVRTEDARPKLTGLIAYCSRQLEKRGADLLVSFADRTHGHHGGIYQAASWSYAGCRGKVMDGVIVDGTFVPGRSANTRWGTRSPSKLTEQLGREVVGHYDEGKHLYFRTIGRRGKAKADRLGLECLPYPKPDQMAAE
jgi:hypothetical protein